MAQKLWEKSVQVNKDIERFTVGRDREMDLYLAKYDVLGSMAHITMLETIGLLTKEELSALLEELKNIHAPPPGQCFTIVLTLLNPQPLAISSFPREVWNPSQ